MVKKIGIFILVTCVLLVGIASYQYVVFHDGKLHVIFCDVGQGDGILIKAPNEQLILVDSGPDRKVLDCLSRHIPFWIRTIDLAALTHPHADHFFGYFFVIPQYKITSFVTEGLRNNTLSYAALEHLISQHHIPSQQVLRGDNWMIGQMHLTVYGPTQEYLDRASPNGLIGETKELGSLLMLVTYGKFQILLTGDNQTDALRDALPYLPQNITVLQTPHHGSASGIDDDVVTAISPQAVAISVGKNNRYGHPNPKVLQIYQNHDIPVYRTDQRGDVEFVSDGEEWRIEK